jgi:hypothetical protein
MHLRSSLRSLFQIRPGGPPQRRRARLELEALEARLTPTQINIGTAPTTVPLSGQVGQSIMIRAQVSLDTADPAELSEGEGFVKMTLSAPGFSVTIDDYTIHTYTIKLQQANEQLTGQLINPPNSDGDEGIGTVEVMPTAKVQVAGPGKSDNIVLYDTPSNPLVTYFGFGSTLSFTQTIPVKITNTGSDSGTFSVEVDPSSGGGGTLSPSSVAIGAGASQTVTFTPNKDSSAVDDVHIVAKFDGVTVGQDDLTVVSVTFNPKIYNTDTPAAMLNLNEYRIPPTKPTNIQVTVSPDLKGNADGQKVTLLIDGQNAGNGTVSINGSGANTPVDITSSGTVMLSGAAQTAPGGHAGNLKLTVQVDAQKTVQSTGFSVSAIPVSFTQTSARDIGGGVLQFVYTWQSDSGSLADLGQVWIGEYVTYSDGGTHVGPGRPWKGNNPDPTITPPRAPGDGTLGTFTDTHSPSGGLPLAGPADSYTATQDYNFHDYRVDNRADDRTQAWAVTLVGPITITRRVYNSALPFFAPSWHYIVTKSGSSATAPLP